MAYGAGPGTGALPVAPLLELVDHLAAEAGGLGAVAAELGIQGRMISAWRSHERLLVSAPVADRILTRAGRNWFEVWPVCPRHEPERPGCWACESHLRARLVFTGEPWPAPWTPDGRRPVHYRREEGPT